MPDLEISCPSADRFVRLLGRYLEVNTRNAGELVAKKAQSVAVELYKAARATAPTEAEIAAKVKSLGWRVRRKKGGWPLRKGEKRGSQGPLHRMQAAQIARRAKAAGTAATGFLPAVDKLGGKVPGKRPGAARNPKGSVAIEGIGTASPRITITNSTPGIGRLQRDHNIVRTAFNEASKDILPYLRRKQAETAAQLRS